MKAIKSISFVFLAIAFSLCVDCCSDDDIYKDNGHFWCHHEQNFAWYKNRDCRWIGEPSSSTRTVWEKASRTLRCSQSESCHLTFEVDYSRELRSYFGVEFNFGGEIADKVGKLTPNLNIKSEQTLTIRSALKTISTCDVAPGHEADIWIGTDIVTLRGRMNILEKQWDGLIFRANSRKCWASDGALEIPVMDKTTGHATGPLECRQRPVADTSDVYFYKNTERNLAQGCETSLMNQALDRMASIVPPKDLEHQVQLRGCGSLTAYVQAKCFNMDDLNSYQSRCRACIRYARDNIMSKAQRSYGANWRVKDCYLRYEFYPFTR